MKLRWRTVTRATKSTSREETPPPPQKNKKSAATVAGGGQDAAIMKTVSCSRPLQLIFPPLSVSPALRESCRISSCSPRWARDAISDTLSHAALTLKLPTLTHTHTRLFPPSPPFFFLRCYRTSHSPLITFQEIAHTHPDRQINVCVCVCKKKTRPEASL